MNRTAVAAVVAAVAVIAALAGCGTSTGQGAAPKTAAPAASPVPQWCADAHDLAAEILAADGLDADTLRTWDNDAHRVASEADKSYSTAAKTATAALAVEGDIVKADFAAEGQGDPATAPGLLKFHADARKLQSSCG